MQYGASQLEFLVDSPAAFAQCVYTRLELATREWFLNSAEGTPWSPAVLGPRTQATRDRAIRDRMAGTQGFKSILSYSSDLIGSSRRLNVNATLDSIFGVVTIQGVF